MNRFALIGLLISAAVVHLTSADTITHEVAFKVGANGGIDWFEIDNPAVAGTLQVNNAPYPSNSELNAAAVDVARNRLIFVVQSNSAAYSVDLTGLQLLQNGATVVNVTSIGIGSGLTTAAGYNKADGRIYYRPENTDELRYLNFDSVGTITGYASVGTMHGSAQAPLTPYMQGGDLDFDASGSLWLTGDNSSGGPRLWNFDPTTLGLINVITAPFEYRGMTFDAAGQNMFGYTDSTSQYGIINTATGGFQTVLATDVHSFDDGGDLADWATATIVIVPEPFILPPVVLVGFITFRRKRRLGCTQPTSYLSQPCPGNGLSES
jgi:hypothetical protein